MDPFHVVLLEELFVIEHDNLELFNPSNPKGQMRFIVFGETKLEFILSII